MEHKAPKVPKVLKEFKVKTKHKKIMRSAPSGARNADIDRFILMTLPKNEAEHEDAVWNFVRLCKGDPRYAEKLVSEMKLYAEKWHQRASPNIGSMLFEDTWARFIEAWKDAKKPLGDMFHAHYNARHSPDPADIRYEDPRKRLLAKVCRELQRINGDKPFYLAGKLAGKLRGIKVDKKTAYRWLMMFTEDGLLELVATGGRPKGGHSKANSYGYLGEM